jgi:hypothetical protein
MRLVIEYTSGDGCTYHCTETFPLEYESAEAFAVDFEVAARLAAQRKIYEFVFANRTFQTDAFFLDGTYYPPEILTVDEWFSRSPLT